MEERDYTTIKFEFEDTFGNVEKFERFGHMSDFEDAVDTTDYLLDEFVKFVVACSFAEASIVKSMKDYIEEYEERQTYES